MSAQAAHSAALLLPLPNTAQFTSLLPSSDPVHLRNASIYFARHPADQPAIQTIRAAYDRALAAFDASNSSIGPFPQAYRAKVLAKTVLDAGPAATPDVIDWLAHEYAVDTDTPASYTTRKVLQRLSALVKANDWHFMRASEAESDHLVLAELARQDRVVAAYQIARDTCGRLNFPFETFKHIANSESGFDADAVNSLTDATGLAQFMPNTWYAYILKFETMPYGPEVAAEIKRLGTFDLAEAQAAIVQTGRFSFTIADPVLAAKVLDARKDPALNTLLAMPMIRASQIYAEHKLHFELSAGMHWLMNILGPEKGVQMLQAAFAHPKGRVGAVINQNIIRDNSLVFGLSHHEFTVGRMLRQLSDISNGIVVPEMLTGAVPPVPAIPPAAQTVAVRVPHGPSDLHKHLHRRVIAGVVSGSGHRPII